MIHLRPNTSLDDILLHDRKWSPGDVIKLRAGTYQTRGSLAEGFCAIPPGVTLDATGSRIELVDPALVDSQPWIEPPLLSAGARIFGGEWDLGDHGGIAQSGFRALGTAHVEGAMLRGLLGRRVANASHPVKEVFAYCAPDIEGDGGTTVDGLTAFVLRDDANNYASGVYTNDRNSVVRGCDMQLGEWGQFAYSCAHSTEFVNCHGEAARFGYTDTGGFRGSFRNCSGRAHWAAWAFAGSGMAPAPERMLLAIGCEIDATGGRVVEFDDTHGEQEALVVLVGGKYVGDYRIASNSKRSRMFAVGAEINATLDYRPNHEPEPIIA
jgi:hypothetical protein